MSAAHDADLAIVGSGFGGSILAMIARRLGHRVMLVERGTHPRFAIGESASPLAGILIEQLADRYDLPRLRPLSAYGTWQRTYPDVGCGLKRGFTYFKHEEGRRWSRRSDRANELLVAASPCDELSDTHWFRADVDRFLVEEAQALGVEYVDRTSIDHVEWGAGGPVLSGVRRGRSCRVAARLLIDASGPRGLLSRLLPVSDSGFDSSPATQALYSHFTGVARCEDLPQFECDREERPPYAVDDAALHHVFDEGWMWVLRFGNGVTSAGVAVTDSLAKDLRLSEGEAAWRRLLCRYPSIAAQFADARPVREFTWMPSIAWRAASAAGERWAMLPSAAAFVDPLFSTGIVLTLVGVERLASLLEREDGSSHPSTSAPALARYADLTLAEADHTARFIAGSYAGFHDFRAFAAYSMFYFAAASFSEMARRLDAPLRPRRFLCADHPTFGPATVDCSPAASSVVPEHYADRVAAAIDCLNVAGLADPAKRNWYPVDLDDTVNAAVKLGLTRAQVEAALRHAS